jgi:hypothetical protein
MAKERGLELGGGGGVGRGGTGWCRRGENTECRQSARLSLLSSALGPPTPHPQARFASPLFGSGVGYTRWGERGWEGSQLGRGNRHCGTLGIV